MPIKMTRSQYNAISKKSGCSPTPKRPRRKRRKQSALPRETEAQFQRRVINLAVSLGFLVYHTFDSRRSQPGYPDLCMVRGDRLIYAELKTNIGKLKTSQEVWLAALQEVAEVYVWRPKMWTEIVEVLR